jgi:NADH-quinone oxidoreductase subunit N
MGGFLFKIGAAPFHFWGPDVYDGAPTPVTGYMASVVKMSAFIGFAIIFWQLFGFGKSFEFTSGIFVIAIILSLFVGNLSAIRQSKLKRVLAFSSIVHVGYTLLIFLQPNLGSYEVFATGFFQILLYMGSYGLGILGIIAVNTAINDKEDDIEALRGLGKRNPFLATVAVISILSLAGVPPTAGFFGKYIVFSSLWNSYWWLILIALINSGISIYYYLKIIIVILSKNEETSEKIKIQPLTFVALLISTIGTLGLGFLLSYLMKL